MKVAISSRSFAAALDAGELTQLEWLEGCASRLGADGVIFERSRFPRSDAEYLAQVKKVTVDLGLVPLAIDEPRLFDPAFDDAAREATLALAAGIGAFFVRAPLPAAGPVPPAAFVAAVSAAKAAVRAAKRVNVTLLAATGAGTLAPDVAGLRHFLKDVDSAWLRYALPAGIDRAPLNARDRVLLVDVTAETDVEMLAEIDEAARPWLAIAGPVDAARIDDVRRAAARRALAAVRNG